jgi:UDP-glucose 4-epimerase
MQPKKTNIKKFIYLSSTAVYGHSATPVTEQTAANPQTYYGISKLRGEEHVNRLGLKSNAIIVRCGNIYGFGPALRFDAVINNFILQANRENRITIHGSGMQLRSFAHVAEVAELLQQVVQHDIPSGTYNFVKRTMRINEIADAIEQIFPGLERIYMNQHIGLNSLEVSEETALANYTNISSRNFQDDIDFFSRQFTFGSLKR